MITAFLVALIYPYQLIVGPIFILALALCLIFLLRYAKYRGYMCGLVLLVGMSEMIALQATLFIWGYVIATVTLFLGVTGCGAFILLWLHNRINKSADPLVNVKLNLRPLRKAAYISLVTVILLSTIVIFGRATNLIIEDYRGDASFPSFYDSPNLTLIGTVQSFELNYTVDTVLCYHIFPAYITLKVDEIVSGDGWWSNNTSLFHDLSQMDLNVFVDKVQAPNLMVGQKVEVCGYYCHWMEDSIYSEKFVVTPSINGSYLNPL